MKPTDDFYTSDENTQPQQSNQQTPLPPPDSYLVWAILTTVCCCLPLGIVSIVYASKVNSLYQVGDYQGALYNSMQAKKWAIWSAAAGVIINVVYGILYAVAFCTAVF